MKYIILLISVLFFISCEPSLEERHILYDKITKDTNSFTIMQLRARTDIYESVLVIYYRNEDTMREERIVFYNKEIGTNPTLKNLYLKAMGEK
jgi:hypothetical protein